MMKLVQQIHKRCGGEIVLVANKKEPFVLACKICVSQWRLNSLLSIELCNDFKPTRHGITKKFN